MKYIVNYKCRYDDRFNYTTSELNDRELIIHTNDLIRSENWSKQSMNDKSYTCPVTSVDGACEWLLHKGHEIEIIK